MHSELVHGEAIKLGPFARLLGKLVRLRDHITEIAIEGTNTPDSGVSGWYIHTGEGRALAEAAPFTKKVDIEKALGTSSFDRAVRAVRDAELPTEATDIALVFAAFDAKYQALRADEVDGAASS